MKVPDLVGEIPFCITKQQVHDETVVETYPDPEAMHQAFDKIEPGVPAYALNFGMIVRAKDIK